MSGLFKQFGNHKIFGSYDDTASSGQILEKLQLLGGIQNRKILQNLQVLCHFSFLPCTPPNGILLNIAI